MRSRWRSGPLGELRRTHNERKKEAAAMASLTISGKMKIMPSIRQHKANERDCRPIVQQLVSSIPHEVLTSTSYDRKEQGNDTQTKTVTFEDHDRETEKLEQKLVQDYFFGRQTVEKAGEFKINTRDKEVCPGNLR